MSTEQDYIKAEREWIGKNGGIENILGREVRVIRMPLHGEGGCDCYGSVFPPKVKHVGEVLAVHEGHSTTRLGIPLAGGDTYSRFPYFCLELDLSGATDELMIGVM